ncbi:sensor domain-containing diguanylate cyclase [Aquabacter spiritensis]|uniref:diguanylate cyclase n=1 Tax=Aquabacter spiritensis TaxID=933073 RepID=A0A4R3LU79_9HYPH|nr:GGDEF domain-containing protein [Aquabacter spiritensis]TCT03159.1 diguanylate cyclase (GGDEF)-like protein [Aquabacter spiritensis]
MNRRLSAQRRLVARLLMASGIVCSGGLWAFEFRTGLISTYDRDAYPILIGVFVLSLGIHCALPARRRVAEWLAFLAYALYCILGILSFGTLDPAARLYTIANTLQWLPLVYVTAFVFFRKWEAIAAAATVYALALLALAWMVATGGTQTWDMIYGSLIVNSYLVNLLMLAMLSLFILTNQAFEDMREQAMVLESVAFSDALTGVANRRGLERILERYAAQPAHDMALILLDLDNFKGVNDRYGHVHGDQVLQAIVGALRQTLRGADQLGRWGGDEFLVLAENTGLGEAQMLAERLRRAVGRLAAAEGVTLSAGVTTWDGSGGLEEALRRVDGALYSAKGDGRDRTALAQPVS